MNARVVGGTTALALGVLIASAGPALANDPAAAQALFDQAQKLMTQERWAEACPKLEESQRLDPGGGTVLHLAACREHEGKTATAWALYQDALSAAKRDGRRDRAKVAQARIDTLGPRLRRLRVKIAAKDKRLAGFQVMRDDTPIGEALWNEPFPVDPGAHTIAASAAGHKKWSTSIDVPATPGETNVDIPELEPDATEPHGAPPRPTRLEEATRGDGQRTVGLALGGVGAVALVAGGIFGVLSFSKQSEADSHCTPPAHTRCTAAGVEAGKQGTTFGNISTIAFIAGGALAVAGVAIYFAAPRGRAGVLPIAGPGLAGLALEARFQ